MSNIIDIEGLRLTRAETFHNYRQNACAHMNLTMDDHGDIVTCDDCKKQVSAFWALQMLVNHYEKARAKLNNRAAQQAEVEAKTIHLRAAQKVEASWRSRTMVPICPHCSEAIFATDGFGRTQINKAIAERARAVRLAAKDEKS